MRNLNLTQLVASMMGAQDFKKFVKPNGPRANKYKPHQGAKEIERRRKRMEAKGDN